jgi:hypothetical protein
MIFEKQLLASGCWLLAQHCWVQGWRSGVGSTTSLRWFLPELSWCSSAGNDQANSQELEASRYECR